MAPKKPSNKHQENHSQQNNCDTNSTIINNNHIEDNSNSFENDHLEEAEIKLKELKLAQNNIENDMKIQQNGHLTDIPPNTELTSLPLEDDDKSLCFDDLSETPLMVYMKDVKYSYDNKTTLIDNLNLNIPAGQIYGLLGPSGCGKSTTLKLMLGLIKPQQGEVKVFGEVPGTENCPVPGKGCGYMPQELSMMPNMSVENHISYYGKLNGMKSREIMKQAHYLLDLLQIPSMDRPIEKLSGGQQRRTSLALALLHSPPLLILDEPTVGIDPLLRNKVWLYLEELAREHHKTIIITTHYIEEARHANTIALMRYGKLLTECNPNRLLQTFQMDTIEDVFLNLCEKEDKSVTDKEANKKKVEDNSEDDVIDKNTSYLQPGLKIIVEKNAKRPILVPYKCDGTRRQSFGFDLMRIYAMMMDAFTYAKFCFITVFGASLLPTLQIYLFHTSVGRPILSLPVSVSVNESQTSGNTFSQFFIENMKEQNVVFEYFPTGKDALASAQEGYSFAAMNFPANYSRCLLNRARRGVDTKTWNIECGQMGFSPDNTFQFVIFQLGLIMKDAFLKAIHQFYPMYGYNPDSINIPFKTEEFIYGQEKFNYQTFMTPGMYMALIFLAPMIVSVFMLLEQKAQGHYERSRANGVKALEVIAAHYSVEFLILLIQNSLMLFTSMIIFQAQNLGSFVLLFLITLFVGMAGISCALSSAVILHTKMAGLILIYGLTISLWMICGIFWPVENIELWIFRMGVPFLPLTLPTESARNIMNRGWGLDHHKVWLGFVVCVGYILLPVWFAVRKLK